MTSGRSSEGMGAVPGGGEGGEGFEVAPGVRFSDKLWSRLGGKALEIEKQRRRDRMGDTSVVPDNPTAIFDPGFRSDAAWRQRCDPVLGAPRGAMRGARGRGSRSGVRYAGCGALRRGH
jgi:hypothetical protein